MPDLAPSPKEKTSKGVEQLTQKLQCAGLHEICDLKEIGGDHSRITLSGRFTRVQWEEIERILMPEVERSLTSAKPDKDIERFYFRVFEYQDIITVMP